MAHNFFNTDLSFTGIMADNFFLTRIMAKSLPLAFPSVLSSPPLWRAPEKELQNGQRAIRTKLKWADYFVANLPNFVYYTSFAKGWASSMLAKSRPTELSAPYKNWWKYGRFTFVVNIFNIKTLETGFICSFLRIRCLIGVYEWNLFVLTWKSHLNIPYNKICWSTLDLSAGLRSFFDKPARCLEIVFCRK